MRVLSCMRRPSESAHQHLSETRFHEGMNISAHALLAILLATSLLLVVLAEATLRRRLRHFRPLQLFTIASAFALVPANIMGTRATEPSTTHTVIVLASVTALVVQFGLLVLNWVSVQQTGRTRRVLAIGAHPDDLELACGGTLARLADAGHEVHTLVMSDGAIGGDSTVRLTEATKGSTFLRATKCEVHGLPDTHLPEYGNEMVRIIEQKIRSLNPDMIFTHSSHDQHQDHNAVHWATMRAGRNHPAILCFESPSVTKEFSPQVFVDIEDWVQTKATAVQIHHDQSDKPYMSEESLTAMSTFRGAQGRIGRAEGFEAVRVNAFSGVL